MKIVATMSLPAVDRRNADRRTNWNVWCPHQLIVKHLISSAVSLASLSNIIILAIEKL